MCDSPSERLRVHHKCSILPVLVRNSKKKTVYTRCIISIYSLSLCTQGHPSTNIKHLKKIRQCTKKQSAIAIPVFV